MEQTSTAHSVDTSWWFFLLQVHIEFTEGEDRITLEGPTKDLQMVQVEIEAMVLDLVSLAATARRP